MSEPRTHFVTTTDGVEIGGTVHGQGPPLVFVQGTMGDGDLDWQGLLPHLSDRFTCHLPSWRGRGLSGDHPDLGLERIVDDVVAYVESVGAPTGLVGWSRGASLAFAAAARSDAVAAVVPFELGVLKVMDEQERAAFMAAGARMGELAAEGRWTEAVRAIAGWPFNDEELAAAEEAGYFEAAGRYVPNLLALLRQWAQHEGPTPEDPAALAALATPTLVLHGSHTRPWFVTSARYVADHVPNARIQEVPGARHAAPLTHPQALAKLLAEFFAEFLKPA